MKLAEVDESKSNGQVFVDPTRGRNRGVATFFG
jgi:hypothetical protein